MVYRDRLERRPIGKAMTLYYIQIPSMRPDGVYRIVAMHHVAIDHKVALFEVAPAI